MLTEIVIIIFAVLILGYGLIATNPKTSEVDAMVDTMLTSVEKKPIKTGIVNDQIIQDIEGYRSFGSHPVSPNADSLNRPNPFEGI